MKVYRQGLEITGAAFAAGVPVLVGTDAPDSFVFPGSSVHEEIGELVKAGLTPAQALRAATLGAAEFLGIADDYGTIEPGKRADMVLLSEDPLRSVDALSQIQGVFLGGRHFDRDALDALLAGAETAAAQSLGPPS